MKLHIRNDSALSGEMTDAETKRADEGGASRWFQSSVGQKLNDHKSVSFVEFESQHVL